MGKKSHKLVENDISGVYLLGIISSENDYRLSWKINTVLQINLAKVDDLAVKQKGETTSKHTRFTYEDEDLFFQYNFLKNKGAGGFLSAELKQFDYFMLLSGGFDQDILSDVNAKIKSVPEVSATMKLDLQKLKLLRNFVF